MSLLTVHGPVTVFWATCDLCHLRSPSFESADDAASWSHECEEEAPLAITVTLTDPPKVRWTPERPMRPHELVEADAVLEDMVRWTYPSLRGDKTWEQCVAEGHARRRAAEADRVTKAAERFLTHPYVCPGCGEDWSSQRGLTMHKRACYRIDPATGEAKTKGGAV